MILPKSKYFTLTFRHILVVMTIASLSLISLHLLVVRKIECYTQYGSCPDVYQQRLVSLTNQPLFFNSTTARVTHLLSDLPEVSSISVYRRIPSVLVISVNLRHAIGLVSPAVLGSQSFVVDDTGTAYLGMDQSVLPALISPKDIRLGEKLSSTEVQALQTLSQLAALSSQRVWGQLQTTTLAAHLGADTEVFIDLTTSLDWKSSLHLLLTRSKITGKIPRKIDLRFNNPVVTY